MNPRGDLAQPAGAVIDRIETGDNGQQRLGGADIAGRLVAADMLFAGLQGHAQGRVAAPVHRDADDAPGQRPGMLAAGREKGRVRPAIAKRHAEALGVADHNIGPGLAGRGDQRQAQEVGRDRDQGGPGMRHLNERARVAQLPAGTRILQ